MNEDAATLLLTLIVTSFVFIENSEITFFSFLGFQKLLPFRFVFLTISDIVAILFVLSRYFLGGFSKTFYFNFDILATF